MPKLRVRVVTGGIGDPVRVVTRGPSDPAVVVGHGPSHPVRPDVTLNVGDEARLVFTVRSAAAVDLLAGLVAYWRLNEPAGGAGAGPGAGPSAGPELVVRPLRVAWPLPASSEPDVVSDSSWLDRLVAGVRHLLVR